MAKVLVIEEDSVLAAAIEDRLRVAGHDVRVLADAARAASAVRDHQPDVLVLDVGRRAGADAVQALRGRTATRTLPLLLLSDRGDASDRVAALRAGADDYLARPFDLEELLLRAERLLGTRTAEQMLQGDLATHPLWAVLQYLQQVRKTGRLRMRSASGSGTLALSGGEPVAAHWERLSGREALLALLCAEEGSFRFEEGSAAPDETGEVSAFSPETLPINELLMRAAWLKDEVDKRRNELPGTGEPLQTLTEFLPTIAEEFGQLPLQRVLERVHRQPGVRLFDLIRDGAEAPLTTRLTVAWLIEHGLIGQRDKAPESAPQNTLEISSALVFDVAVATLIDAAGKAGFDTTALPYLVLVEPAVWPALRRLIEQAPGYRTNETLHRLVEQVELRRAGSATFSGDRGRISLHVQVMSPAAQAQVNAILSGCAGVLVWIDGAGALEGVQPVIQRLDAGGNRGSGMLVAGTAAVQKETERLVEGSRRWRSTPHAPKSLLGLFRLLQPHETR